MRRIAVIVVAVLAVGTWIAGCGAEKSDNPDDVFATSFEARSKLEIHPSSWFPTQVPRTKEFVDFQWDDKVAHTGSRSVSIAIAAAHPDERIAYNWTRPIPGCEEGESYELSGWIKTEALKGPAWICVQCWDDSRSKMIGFASTQMDYPITGTSDWTQVGTVFDVPEGTAEVRVRAGIATPENRGGRVWFDDLRIRHLDQGAS